MNNTIQFFNAARIGILKGVNLVANTVAVSMGPKGRNVIIDKGQLPPVVTNDGVTIANSILIQDSLQNIGATIVKQAADKTNTSAGDGTTATVVLTRGIVQEGLRYLEKGVNPFGLTRALQNLVKYITDVLNAYTKKIENDKELFQIASLSAQDDAIGRIITDCIKAVGNEGTVTVDLGPTAGLKSEIKQGMQFDQGYISSYFVTDEGRQEVVIDSPMILITEHKILSRNDIGELLDELCVNDHRDFLIICESMEGEALTTMLYNVNKIHAVVVKAPGFGNYKRDSLQDIAILTGATVVRDPVKLSQVTDSVMGKAEKVIVTKDNCTIIGGMGSPEAITLRIDNIKGLNNETPLDLEQQQTRLARLAGGIATIKVGAATEMEAKNRKYKIEDALNATKSAIQEGIIAGGGVALYRIAMMMDKLDIPKNYELEIAIQIMVKALQYPIKQIINNAGYDSKPILRKINELAFNIGFNANSGEYCDMVDDGIIDPVKVIRVALENAVSAATMILTCDAVVLDSNQER